MRMLGNVFFECSITNEVLRGDEFLIIARQTTFQIATARKRKRIEDSAFEIDVE